MRISRSNILGDSTWISRNLCEEEMSKKRRHAECIGSADGRRKVSMA
jgi:hypothetical protein